MFISIKEAIAPPKGSFLNYDKKNKILKKKESRNVLKKIKHPSV